MIITHNSGHEIILKIFNEQKIVVSPSLFDMLLELLSKICIYEEEEHKIQPLLIIGTDLDTYFKQCPFHFKQEVFTDDLLGSNFNRIMKSLIPLCNNNWYVYIDINETLVKYGVFRQFKSATSVDFEDMFFIEEKQKTDSIGFICIRPFDKSSFLLKSIGQSHTIISFSFTNCHEQSINDIDAFCNDICEKTYDDKEYIRKALKRILLNMPNKLHGAICLLVDEDYAYPNNYVTGLELSPPLDLISCIKNTKEINTYEDAERFYAITNLFYEFLNVDGITLLNTSGQIIGYNAFYRSGNTPTNIVGGARKRTFEGLKSQMNEYDCKIKGIYYQSQDGNYQYARRKNNE